MAELIYKELCYQIYGLCYKIHNTMGSVYNEKQYQNAFEAILKSEQVSYSREKDLKFEFGTSVITGNIVDFVVENKIPVDFKAKRDILLEKIFVKCCVILNLVNSD